MKILRIILLFIAVLCVSELSAQTFKCVDVEFHDNSLSQSRKYEIKMRGLGGKIKISVFKNSLKIEDLSTDSNPMILDKVNDNQYLYTKSNGNKTVVKLNTILGYIRGLEIIGYIDGKMVGKTIFERD